MKLKSIGLMTLAIAVALAPPVWAFTSLRRTFVSESGRTTVTILQNSDWEQPGARIGTYQQVGGAGGILTNTGQEDPMGFYTQFRDTSGAERCVGRMHIFIDDSGRNGYNSETVWQIDGTVPGYQCSTVGQTMRLNVQEVPQMSQSSDRPSVAEQDHDQIARIVVQHLTRDGGTAQAQVGRVKIVGNYALAHWTWGEAGGQALLLHDNDGWSVLTSGGGAMDATILRQFGVPTDAIAQQLLTQ